MQPALIALEPELDFDFSQSEPLQGMYDWQHRKQLYNSFISCNLPGILISNRTATNPALLMEIIVDQGKTGELEEIIKSLSPCRQDQPCVC